MNDKEEHLKGRFWILNRFVREYAKGLSVYSQMIYVCLCCYAGSRSDKEYKTFVGYRRIADNLNINKDTVTLYVKELEAYGLVRRLKNKNGKPSLKIIYTDPYDNNKAPHTIGHKDVKDIKESEKKKKYGLEDLRTDLKKRRTIK